MTNTTHTITDGVGNWLFRISGDAATVIQVLPWGATKIEDKITTTKQARKFEATLLGSDCTKGWTRLMKFRKLTTWEQVNAHIAANYDMSLCNAPKAALAIEHEFRECGCLNVRA